MIKKKTNTNCFLFLIAVWEREANSLIYDLAEHLLVGSFNALCIESKYLFNKTKFRFRDLLSKKKQGPKSYNQTHSVKKSLRYVDC